MKKGGDWGEVESDRGKHKRKYSRTITVIPNWTIRETPGKGVEEYKVERERGKVNSVKLNAPRMVNKGVVISTWER
jgi:hypothetical protein